MSIDFDLVACLPKFQGIPVSDSIIRWTVYIDTHNNVRKKHIHQFKLFLAYWSMKTRWIVAQISKITFAAPQVNFVAQRSGFEKKQLDPLMNYLLRWIWLYTSIIWSSTDLISSPNTSSSRSIHRCRYYLAMRVSQLVFTTTLKTFCVFVCVCVDEDVVCCNRLRSQNELMCWTNFNL